MLNVMIIDNNAQDRAAISNILSGSFKDLNIRELESPKNSMDLIIKKSIDLIFLHEKLFLPEKSTFDLIKNSNSSLFDLVIISENENNELKMHESELDYISKPLDKIKICDSITKVIKRKNEIIKGLGHMVREFNMFNSLNKKISLCDKYSLIFPKVSDILYLKADGFYTKFFLKDHTQVLVSKNIKEYETLLPSEHFFRVHKSYLINLNEISKYIKGDGGYILMENGDTVPISVRKKEDFLRAIMNYQLNHYCANGNVL